MDLIMFCILVLYEYQDFVKAQVLLLQIIVVYIMHAAPWMAYSENCSSSWGGHVWSREHDFIDHLLLLLWLLLLLLSYLSVLFHSMIVV